MQFTSLTEKNENLNWISAVNNFPETVAVILSKMENSTLTLKQFCILTKHQCSIIKVKNLHEIFFFSLVHRANVNISNFLTTTGLTAAGISEQPVFYNSSK